MRYQLRFATPVTLYLSTQKNGKLRAGAKMKQCAIVNGNCLDVMTRIPSNSIDLILCDLPYAMTAASWDVVIPFEPLWEQYRRIGKENCAYVLTAKGQFMFDLVFSNREWYRYELVWDKNKAANFAHCNKRPLITHEYVLIFYNHLPTYNPQMTLGKAYTQVRGEHSTKGTAPNIVSTHTTKSDGRRFPKSVINVAGHAQRSLVHPTQKPIALMEYLIKTYSNVGDLVLDNCMGSGTTGVACINTKRRFLGIEKKKEYYDIAKARIANLETMTKIF
jgi:site-specific DNA-methyltransferase (adenine-specific)